MLVPHPKLCGKRGRTDVCLLTGSVVGLLEAAQGWWMGPCCLGMSKGRARNRDTPLQSSFPHLSQMLVYNWHAGDFSPLQLPEQLDTIP
ncbi:hypothetical protein BC830DRAFT_1222348 [Chytriomyces sp. MP71]|nr:hypothetical protein BC830DRAFT_1222348 [Chytriomyces sp. MP71]